MLLGVRAWRRGSILDKCALKVGKELFTVGRAGAWCASWCDADFAFFSISSFTTFRTRSRRPAPRRRAWAYG